MKAPLYLVSIRRQGCRCIYISGLSTFSRSYFEELFSFFESPSCIVLDNYQEVSHDSLLHEVIRSGLEIIPEGTKVIVMSRKSPPSQLAQLRASHDFGMLDKDYLRLTTEETLGIMKMRLQGRGYGRVSRAMALKINRSVSPPRKEDC